MILNALALLPVLAAGPIQIGAVGTNFDGERLTVEVETDGKVAAKDVMVKGGKRRFYLYIVGARSEKPEHFTPERTVVAHPRARYTKLEIPWGNGVDCADTVAVEGIPGGVRASVDCHAQGGKGKAAAQAAAPAAKGAVGEEELLKAALALPSASDRKKALRAEVAPAPATGERETAAPSRAEAAAATKKAAEPAPAPRPTEAAPVEAKAHAPEGAAGKAHAAEAGKAHAAEAGKAHAAEKAPAHDAKPAAEGKPSSSLGGMMVPAVALGALAIAAFVLSRRRARKSTMIKILESASLGPKRALVVAEVNGRTMVLGSSEAGITLLGSLDEAGDVKPAAAMPAADVGRAVDTTEEIAVDEAPDREPSDQEGVLARLFRNRAVAEEPAPTSEVGWKQFDDLLNESIEDQELRRKLATGLPVKVS